MQSIFEHFHHPPKNPTPVSSHSPSLPKPPHLGYPLTASYLWNGLFWTVLFPICGVLHYVFFAARPLSLRIVCVSFLQAASRLSHILCPHRLPGSPTRAAALATGSPLCQGFPNARLPSLWRVPSTVCAGSQRKAPSAPCLLPQEIHFSVLSTI